MPKIKNKTTEEKEKKAKPNSPFKDIALLEKEITDFLNKFKTTVAAHSKRVSDYFEMSCFNDVVRFYQLNGYTIAIENLQDNEYKYKCSTSGVQANFSHFSATITTKKILKDFEIHHNLAVQSSHDVELFTTPDITIIKKGKAKTTTGYYDTKRRFSYVKNNDMMSFCECKQFNPFPELIFNFIGVVNELRHQIIDNNFPIANPIHIAPSLMISGKPNKQSLKIKTSLENRYCVNIIYDLFYSRSATFSRKNITALKTSGKLPK
jgi:hypothetical protein